jgi:hypothetical protein
VNRYTHEFTAICCANQKQIKYRLVIETQAMIRVEEIVETCDGFESGFHEDIADNLFNRFGGKQTITAHHHGVDIETVRA